MKKPVLCFWIKYHWHIVRWIPCGGRLWRWASNVVDRWAEWRLEQLRKVIVK